MSTITINVVTRSNARVALEASADQTLMEILRSDGLVEALCGGQAACATCHVHIDDEWMNAVGEAEGQELDMLGCSLEQRPNSRLSCQVPLSRKLDGLSLSIAEGEG